MTMKMKRDWTEIVKDKLSDSTATPPDDLWTGISSELDAAMPPLLAYSKSKQWRWWTVAACLATAFVCGIYFLIPSQQETGLTNIMIADTESQDENEGNPINNEELTIVTKITNKHLAYNTPTTSTHDPQSVPVKDGELPAPTTQPQTYDEVFNGGEVQTTNTPGKKDQNATTIMVSNGDHDVRLTNRKGAGSSRSLSIGLYASNTNMPRLGTGAFDVFDDLVQDYEPGDGGYESSSTDSPQPSYTLKDAKYRQPLRFGLSARFPVSSSLSLSSGLVYSRLSSTMTWESKKGATFETNQTLNYIGIPVSIEYSLPSYQSLGFYLTAGAMVEKCISGEAKSLYSNKKEKITESTLQLSMFAGAGVQLNINRHISLYAEPLATYYIDNHSDIINIYKDRKLNLDLRVGLRYTLK